MQMEGTRTRTDAMDAENLGVEAGGAESEGEPLGTPGRRSDGLMRDNLDTLGGRIRHARSCRGWNRPRLAQETGMKTATIVSYETGKKTPSAATLRLLSRTLGVSHSWLVSRTGPMDPEPEIEEDDEALASIDLKAFGARLRQAREEHGWVQADLARELSVSPPMISLYENGRGFPTRARLEEMAGILGVDASWLETGGEPVSSQADLAAAGLDTLASRLKYARSVLGWSQDRLAREAGVQAASLSMYENGKRIPQGRILRAVCDAMGMDTTWLASGRGNGPTPPEKDELDHALADMDLDEFGARVRQARTEWGWQQSRLARECGVCPTVMSTYETGRVRPTRQGALTLCEVLSLNPEWLLAGEGPERTPGAVKPEENEDRLDKEGFSRRMRSSRLARGWTMPELAHQTGIRVDSLVSYETARKHPRSANVKLIARMLGVDDAWLLYGRGEGPELPVDVDEMLDSALGREDLGTPAARLAFARTAHGWPIALLASEASILPEEASDYETGQAEPDADSLEGLAWALGVTPSWIQSGEGPVRREPDAPRPAKPRRPLRRSAASTFAQRLRKAREACGWTQSDLGRESGLTTASIASYERGRSRPRYEAMKVLADTLNVSVDWLGSGDGSMTGAAGDAETATL